MSAALKAERLRKVFSTGKAAVDDVSFHVAAGEIVVQGLLALAFYPAITWALGRLRAAARI